MGIGRQFPKKVFSHFQMNKLIRIILFISTAFMTYSCGTGLNVRKSQLKYFDETLSITVDNNPYEVHGRNYGNPSLLELLEIYSGSTNNVLLNFIGSAKLEITYTDSGTVKQEIFNGHFSKKGYFEIFLRNESKVIPIIYSRRNINRIRMALTVHGNLIIDNAWDEGGHILIFAAGDSGRRQSYFNKNDLE